MSGLCMSYLRKDSLSHPCLQSCQEGCLKCRFGAKCWKKDCVLPGNAAGQAEPLCAWPRTMSWTEQSTAKVLSRLLPGQQSTAGCTLTFGELPRLPNGPGLGHGPAVPASTRPLAEARQAVVSLLSAVLSSSATSVFKSMPQGNPVCLAWLRILFIRRST